MKISMPRILAFSLIVMLTGLSAFFLTSCKQHRASKYDSVEALSEELIERMNAGDTAALSAMVISGVEYAAVVHPFTPEGKGKNSIDGKYFFDTFIAQQRAHAISRNASVYKGKINRIIEIGRPSATVHTEKFTILREIPLTIEILDENNQLATVVDRHLLGAVVEQKGRYRLLNIFFD